MDTSRERKIGAAVFGVGVLILVLIVFFLGTSGSRALRYKISFRSAENLKVGDRVQMSGVDIGEVDRVDLAPDGKSVAVQVKIGAGHREKILADSTGIIASPSTINVSGQKIVEIHNSTRPSAPMQNGQTVEGKDNSFELTAWQLKGKVQDWSESLSKATKDLGQSAKDMTESMQKAAKDFAKEVNEGVKEGFDAAKKNSRAPNEEAPIPQPTPEMEAPPVGEGEAPQPVDPQAPSRARETMKKLTQFLGELGTKGKNNIGDLTEKWDSLKREIAPVMKDLTDRGLTFMKTQMQKLMGEIEEQLEKLKKNEGRGRIEKGPAADDEGGPA